MGPSLRLDAEQRNRHPLQCRSNAAVLFVQIYLSLLDSRRIVPCDNGCKSKKKFYFVDISLQLLQNEIRTSLKQSAEVNIKKYNTREKGEITRS